MSDRRRRSGRVARCSTCRRPTSARWRRRRRIPCDALILDLEDAVAPDAKPAARDAACAAAASGEYGRARGDDPGQRRRHRVARRRPQGRLRRRAGRDRRTQGEQRRRGARSRRRRWRRSAHPSTPRCGRWSRPRSRCCTPRRSPSASDRLTVLVMGTNDLAKELYAEHVPGRQPLLTGLGLALLAARATGKAILDGVYNDVQDTDGFLAECRQGRELGFDGKTLIHPGQVDGANTAFAPSEEAVDDARGHPAGVGGRRRLGRGHLPRPDDREPPRRHRAPHPRHPRGDRSPAGLTWPRTVSRRRYAGVPARRASPWPSRASRRRRASSGRARPGWT